jgi:hypothetical protein
MDAFHRHIGSLCSGSDDKGYRGMAVGQRRHTSTVTFKTATELKRDRKWERNNRAKETIT